MFVTNLAQAFGQDIPATPPTVDPAMLTIAGLLFDVESKLKQTFNQLQIFNAVAPDQAIDLQLISSYQIARADFVRAAEIWRQAYEATPAEERFDPDAVPVFPPEINVASIPIVQTGFGAAGTIQALVPVSQLTVTYGPVGREKTVPLGAALGDCDFHQWYGGSRTDSGLGAAPVIIVAYLIGLAITGYVVVRVVDALTGDRSRIEVARADAERQQAFVRLVLAAFTTMQTLATKCIGTSQDVAVNQRCVVTAMQAALAVLRGAAPLAITPSSPPGISAFGIFGIILGVAAIAGGGYAIYRYRQRKSSQMGKFSKRH